MSYKKRILFVSEASFLNTGFSNIIRSLLPRLAATGKFELAEQGSYSDANHPDIANFIAGRWKFYPGLPSTQEESVEFNKYIQNPRPRARGQNTAQFGEWNFSQVVADFKPDLVVSIRDFWMDEFIEFSPFREWFKHIWMPTVDSPQQDEVWIDAYEKVNLCLAYSDFGIHTLKSQSSRIKLFPKPMRPGVDLDVFKPMDKGAIREKFNLSKDIPIIGIVQRNQSRKNILDVIDAFSMMKIKYKGEEKIDKATLLIHSSWPDNAFSFDYPRHIKRLNSSKWMKHHNPNIMYSILQDLLCHSCGQTSVCFAVNLHGRPVQQQDINGRKLQAIFMPCSYCGKNTATCPTTGLGFTREQLAEIYNLMDVFVQCSIAEGDGMPATESKSCGIPIIVTDHSATAEKGRFPTEYIHFKETGVTEDKYTVHKGGITHKIAAYRHEPETGCLRAVPDTKDLCESMHDLIMNDELRKKMSIEAVQCVKDNYDWDKMAKQWEYVLDNVKPLDRSETWDSSIENLEDIKSAIVPDNLNNIQYVEWLYLNILKYTAVDAVGSAMWVDHLNKGATREQIMQQFVMIGNQQLNSSKTRDSIRRAMNGSQKVEKKVQEFI